MASLRDGRLVVVPLSLTMGIGAVGCLDRDIAPAEPSTQSGVLQKIQQTGTTKLDILFMVDNSNSMREEQEVLAEQIVVMVQELISPSRPGTAAVEDMHIGIVTSDMGTGGYAISTCSNSTTGDNGVLQNRDQGTVLGCQPTYSAPGCRREECPWLAHSVEYPDADPANDPIWEDFGCIATLGTGGCGFEQQMESTLAALTVQAGPGMPNEGFLRPDSLLAIIYVSDEDDCSASNDELFNQSRSDLGPLNTRCAFNPDLLHPVSRYHDAFLDLVGGDPDRIVVAAITGVPVDGSWEYGDSVDLLRELQVADPEDPNQLRPSCDTAMGIAFPPVRFAELIYSFGQNGVLESICNHDWTPALLSISGKILENIHGVCVSRPLASTDSETCRVIETLIDDRECPNAPPDPESFDPEHRPNTIWRLDRGLVEEPGLDGQLHTRRLCEILPADYDGDQCPDGSDVCPPDAEVFPAGLQGWFYDSSNPDCEYGQVRFTSRDVTEELSKIRFECLTALCPVQRQCAGAIAPEQFSCDGPGDCGDDGVCVTHISGDVCGTYPDGGPRSCYRCSPTLGATCANMAELPGAVSDLALIGAGGCCAEGFHCEANACVPDHTTVCE